MDLEALRGRIEARVAALTGERIEVRGLRYLTGGACQDNLRVELTVGAGELEVMALRSDARTSLPGSLGRDAECAVIHAAVAAGVHTPAARWLSKDLVREGAWAYFLDWVEGDAIGAKVTRHPTLARARAELANDLAHTLAAIHTITPINHPELPLDRAPFARDADPATAALAFVRQTLDGLPHARPASELALRWLREHRPAPHETTLVHADFRTGNFMVTHAGLAGVLDWEFAHWGDPMEDLGWICVRDWRFGQVDKPVGGFATRDAFHASYAEASGRAVDLGRVHWWEICGNLRWGSAAAVQGQRYLGGEKDIELLAIPRRAAEMEYEALRLIEVGA